METILQTLIRRGDRVSIQSGCLVIHSLSGTPVPAGWMADHESSIIADILGVTKTMAFRYLSYSTGRYVRGSVVGGMTLQLESLNNNADVYAIFNVALTRCRNTKRGKAGDPLPKGQFRVAQRSAFLKFWLSTGLNYHRLSDFHDYMGNLAGVLLTGDINDGRVVAGSLRALSICADVITDLVTDKYQTNSRQHSDITPTRVPDKKTVPAQHAQVFRPFFSASDSSCGMKEKRNDEHKGVDSLSILRKSPQEQTHAEWLTDFSGP